LQIYLYTVEVYRHTEDTRENIEYNTWRDAGLQLRLTQILLTDTPDILTLSRYY